MNFTHFINYLKHEKRYSAHTVSAYETDLGQFQVYSESNYEILEVKEVTHSVVRSWILSLMESGTSPLSVKRKISALRSYFKFCIQGGLLKQDPMQKVLSPKTSKQLPTFVKEAEMKSLLSEMEFADDFEGWRDKLILELLYQTGMRVSELISLKEKDVDISTNSLKVLGKRNKERIIPISPNLIALINVYLIKKRDEFSDSHLELITLNSGKITYRKFVYEKVKYYLTQVSSLKKKSPHILRHTFATHMLKNGADLNAIKEILGHSNLAATQVYAHNTLEQLKDVHKMAHPRSKK